MTRTCPTCSVTTPGTHCFACGRLVPVEPKLSDQHAVFVTLRDEFGRISKHRVSDWMAWSDAIDMWQAMDDQRREAIAAKGLVAHCGTPITCYEVRSAADPGYNALPVLNLVRGFVVYSREYATDVAAAKAVLKPLGYYAKEGGWVYYLRGFNEERVLTQGWWKAAQATGHFVSRLPGEKGYRAAVHTNLLVHQEA